MAMRVLVCGGAGYLGSILTSLLLEKGCEVVVYDSLEHGQPSLLGLLANPRLTVRVGDVCDQGPLGQEIKHADAIIALAALVGAPLCDRFPSRAEAVNRRAIEFIASAKSKNQILLYPCSNSGYGIGESGIFCTEDSPLRPVSHYGITKVEAEKAVLSRESGVSLRLATLFGLSPRMRLDLLVNDFTIRALRDRTISVFEGHFKRNYLHVRDAARAFLFALENYEKMKGKAFNVGLSDANLSKLELCQLIKGITPFEIMESAEGRDPDQRNYIISNEKIEQLGYRTEHTLDEGIREIIRAYPLLSRNGFANA